MASVSRAIIERVLVLLQGITFDGVLLDADSGRVVLGDPEIPESPPRIYVQGATIPSTDGHDLGSYSRVLTLRIDAYVGGMTGDSDTAEAKFLAAHDLANEIVKALEADRTLSGRVVNMRISSEVDALLIRTCGLGVASLDVEVEYIAASGVGT
jgi:hypothetical protein